MRIPKSAQFVLFQFLGDGAAPGRVLITPGRRNPAGFDALISRLHAVVTRKSTARHTIESGAVVVPRCSCLIYRQRGAYRYNCATNVADKRLAELCRTFTGWLDREPAKRAAAEARP